jgi:hypothetical protein
MCDSAEFKELIAIEIVLLCMFLFSTFKEREGGGYFVAPLYRY